MKASSFTFHKQYSVGILYKLVNESYFKHRDICPHFRDEETKCKTKTSCLSKPIKLVCEQTGTGDQVSKLQLYFVYSVPGAEERRSNTPTLAMYFHYDELRTLRTELKAKL